MREEEDLDEKASVNAVLRAAFATTLTVPHSHLPAHFRPNLCHHKPLRGTEKITTLRTKDILAYKMRSLCAARNCCCWQTFQPR